MLKRIEEKDAMYINDVLCWFGAEKLLLLFYFRCLWWNLFISCFFLFLKQSKFILLLKCVNWKFLIGVINYELDHYSVSWNGR